MASGTARLNPGLISAAHHGVLYVDEINLLADHLVDVLLDAAASGRLSVERDGVSATAPAEFALVGTMNPEEGELRPQLLDRFGLSVAVSAPHDAAERVEIISRRMAFDAEPEVFCAQYAAAENALAAQLAAAQELLPTVVIARTELRRIAYVCVACEVQGMRADVVMAHAAVAHAALAGRAVVRETDVRAVASFVLPHRRRRDPFDPTGMSEADIDAAFAAARDALADSARDKHAADQHESPDATGGPDPLSGDDGPDGDGDDTGPGGAEDPDTPPPPPPAGPAASPAAAPDCRPDGDAASVHAGDAGDAGDGGHDSTASGDSTGHVLAGLDLGHAATARPTVLRAAGRAPGSRGRRSAAYTSSGRAVPAVSTTGGARIDIPATVRTAARRLAAGPHPAPLAFTRSDVQRSRSLGRSGDLVAFLVDTSGSMAARRRLELVAQSAVAVLRDAYVRRDVVGVVTAGGHGAVTALAPTRSVDLAVTTLTAAPTGGRTPLAEGLTELARMISTHRLREPSRRAIVLCLTDGRATAGAHARERAITAARALAALPGVFPVVVDCEAGRVRLGEARGLARAMRAPSMALDELTAGGVAELARAM